MPHILHPLLWWSRRQGEWQIVYCGRRSIGNMYCLGEICRTLSSTCTASCSSSMEPSGEAREQGGICLRAPRCEGAPNSGFGPGWQRALPVRGLFTPISGDDPFSLVIFWSWEVEFIRVTPSVWFAPGRRILSLRYTDGVSILSTTWKLWRQVHPTKFVVTQWYRLKPSELQYLRLTVRTGLY